MNKIDITWKHDMAFEAHQEGRTFGLISSARFDPEGTSVSPKQLLLTALAGCSGMDLASLLPKMRVPFTSINIHVQGEMAEDHPKIYTSMHMVYEIGADAQYLPQIEKAIELSETRYCSVSAMLRKASSITHEIKLV